MNEASFGFPKLASLLWRLVLAGDDRRERADQG